MARHPRPTVIKKLQGEPNKNRINNNEPQPQGKTTPPRFLNRYAKNEWKRLYKELENLDLLKNVDRMAFAEYCQAVGMLVETENKINELTEKAIKTGGDASNAYLLKTQAGNVIISPLLSIRNRLIEQVHMLGCEFGMTPVSRSRINVQPKPKEEDPMEKLLSSVPNSEL
jgi:P27 family predicted phage terminase small subunit